MFTNWLFLISTPEATGKFQYLGVDMATSNVTLQQPGITFSFCCFKNAGQRVGRKQLYSKVSKLVITTYDLLQYLMTFPFKWLKDDVPSKYSDKINFLTVNFSGKQHNYYLRLDFREEGGLKILCDLAWKLHKCLYSWSNRLSFSFNIFL